MELLQVQEELNIVIQLTQQQIELISDVQSSWDKRESRPRPTKAESLSESDEFKRPSRQNTATFMSRSMLKQRSTAKFTDPLSQLQENINREYLDLCDLRDNSNNLVNRTIQLVNIRMEDHGKAILVFTVVTIIFLPLSFVSSYLGMNTIDIRDMKQSQTLFWIIAASLTVATMGIATFVAFYGHKFTEQFFNWKAKRREPGRPESRMDRFTGKKKAKPPQKSTSLKTFEVLDGSFGPGRPGFWSNSR